MWQLVYPLSSFLAIFIIESFLEALNYHVVRPLDLTIGPWVCNKDIFDLDARIFTELQNWLVMKFEPRSVMMVFGKPKRCKISEMKSTTLWQNQPELHQFKCIDPFSEVSNGSTALQTVYSHGLLGKVPIKLPNSGSKQGTSHEGESSDTNANHFYITDIILHGIQP
jgi:hypothetical protein